MQLKPNRPHRLGAALLLCAGLLAQTGSGQTLDPHPLLGTATPPFAFEWSWEPDEVLSLPLPVRSGSPEPSPVQRPLVFEPNQGQTAEEVAFISRGRGYTLFLTRDEAVLRLNTAESRAGAERLGVRQPSAAFELPALDSNASEDWRTPKPCGDTAVREESDTARVLRMRLAGANANPMVHGQDLQRAKANYFIGNDSTRWRTQIPTYGQVRFTEVYEGIDLVYYGNEGRLEYDFVVAPGADPYQIAMEFDGAERLEIARNGDLVLSVGGREVRWQKPFIYQEVDGRRIEIAGRYRVRHTPDRSTLLAAAEHATTPATAVPTVQFVAFELAAYDSRLPLVIDPILLYSSYLGGSGDDGGQGVVVDNDGSVYVAGYTASDDFPTRNALQSQHAGDQWDVFAAKFSSMGELLFSTYLGGSGDDGPLFDPVRIALSPDGECYVVGATASWDFPVVNAVQQSFAGGAGDAFVTGLSADGSALTFSTYLGGSLGEGARNLAFGPNGDLWIVGSTFSSDFPVVNAFQPQLSGDREGFITRLDTREHRIASSTFHGGASTREWVQDVVLDAEGHAYVSLWVTHVTLDRYQWAIAKFSPDGSNRLWERRWPTAMTAYQSVSLRPLIGLAPNDTVVLAGSAWGIPLPASNSPHPMTNPTLDMGTAAGFSDLYVALFSATDGAHRTAVYFGGAGGDHPSAISVNKAGEIVIAGSTGGAGWEPSGFPVTDPLEASPTPGTSQDVFVAKFRSSDLSVTFSTLFGGAGDEDAIDMALDAHGNPWIVGQTRLWRTHAQLPTWNAFQPEPGGGEDAFLVHLSLRGATLQITRSGQTLTLSWPIAATNYILEAADSPLVETWQSVTETPVVTDNDRSVQLPVTGQAQFFRLRGP